MSERHIRIRPNREDYLTGTHEFDYFFGHRPLLVVLEGEITNAQNLLGNIVMLAQKTSEGVSWPDRISHYFGVLFPAVDYIFSFLVAPRVCRAIAELFRQ